MNTYKMQPDNLFIHWNPYFYTFIFIYSSSCLKQITNITNTYLKYCIVLLFLAFRWFWTALTGCSTVLFVLNTENKIIITVKLLIVARTNSLLTNHCTHDVNYIKLTKSVKLWCVILINCFLNNFTKFQKCILNTS